MPYSPPIGIPTPPFGIDQVNPTMPSPWTTNLAGFYYVAAGGTNAGNGFPTSPRGSIPTTIADGEVCFVERGGTFNVTSGVTWTINGTLGSPAWILAAPGAGARPLFKAPTTTESDSDLDFSGTFFIIDNLQFSNKTLNFGNATTDFGFRNNEVKDVNAVTNNFGAAIGMSSVRGVYYNNDIHENGQWQSGVEWDVHGFKGSPGGDTNWILDSRIFHCGGDAIQLGDATEPEPWCRNTFIGRNDMYENRENAVDLKKCRRTIVSQNKMHNHVPVDTSAGDACVVHDSGEDVWIIFNDIYSNHNDVGSTGFTGFYAIGNIIRNNLGSPTAGSFFGNGIGGYIRASSSIFFLENTFVGIPKFLSAPQSGSAAVVTQGNIFVDGGTDFHIGYGTTGAAGACTLRHNLSRVTPLIRASSTTYSGFAAFDAAFPAAIVDNNVTADPIFVNQAGGDFHLQSSSPARDANVTTPHAAYTTFETQFPTAGSIKKDWDGNLRPVPGTAWDIGAFEFGSGPVPPPVGVLPTGSGRGPNKVKYGRF